MSTTAQRTLQNFIDGEFVEPAEGATEDVLNPATGEVIAQAPLSGAEDVNRAVAAARRAFDEGLFSTVLTLYLVPVAYMMVDRLQERVRGRRRVRATAATAERGAIRTARRRPS